MTYPEISRISIPRTWNGVTWELVSVWGVGVSEGVGIPDGRGKYTRGEWVYKGAGVPEGGGYVHLPDMGPGIPTPSTDT